MWVLGGLAGATIAIKVYAHVGLGQGSALVAVLLAAAVGLIVGFLADRHRAPLLAAVTALSPVIGYDKASAIAHKANDEGLTLKEAAIASGYIDEKPFDEIVDPRKMVGHGVAGS